MLTGKIRCEAPTSAELVGFLEDAPSKTIRAWMWYVDDAPVAVAGWYVEGTRAVVFSEIREDVSKVRIWKEALRFMRAFDLPMMCITTPESEPFLKRLGWKKAYSGPAGEVYTCN